MSQEYTMSSTTNEKDHKSVISPEELIKTLFKEWKELSAVFLHMVRALQGAQIAMLSQLLAVEARRGISTPAVPEKDAISWLLSLIAAYHQQGPKVLKSMELANLQVPLLLPDTELQNSLPAILANLAQIPPHTDAVVPDLEQLRALADWIQTQASATKVLPGDNRQLVTPSKAKKETTVPAEQTLYSDVQQHIEAWLDKQPVFRTNTDEPVIQKRLLFPLIKGKDEASKTAALHYLLTQLSLQSIKYDDLNDEGKEGSKRTYVFLRVAHVRVVLQHLARQGKLVLPSAHE